MELIIYIIFIISVLSFISLAPWVPTKNSDLDRINKIIKLKQAEKLLEMWTGTAKVSLYLASQNKDSYITGIELSPFFYLISKLRVYFSGLDNIEIIYWNALKLDLENYDAIYVFWLPETVTNKVFPKIKHIKNKNFRFISYCFKMTNTYFKETKHKTENKYAIYEYSPPPNPLPIKEGENR